MDIAIFLVVATEYLNLIPLSGKLLCTHLLHVLDGLCFIPILITIVLYKLCYNLIYAVQLQGILFLNYLRKEK
jgi:hypothetical protein